MKTGNKDFFKLGSHNVICDVCGFKFKGDELQKRWDGLMTCKQDFEERQPQDLIRGINDNQSPLYIRDMPDTLTFIPETTTDGSDL